MTNTPNTASEQALSDAQIDAAAKVMAQCMDYPWDHMPEQGRDKMREHARAVIAAAGQVQPLTGTRDVSAVQQVEWPDDGELEAWRSTADDLLRSLPDLRGPDVRRAAHLLQNAYLFASKGSFCAARAADSEGARSGRH